MRKLFDDAPRTIEPISSPPARRAPQPTQKQKVKILGRAIADAAKARGSVSVLDGTQAGFSEVEVRKFWDDAMVEARAIFPGMADLAVSP